MCEEFIAERRKYKRFPVQEGAIAVIRDNTTLLGQIGDISMGGLYFQYIETENASIHASRIAILMGAKGFYLENMPFKYVSDELITDNSFFTSIPMRRLGIQFEDLNSEQERNLRFFIQNCTSPQL